MASQLTKRKRGELRAKGRKKSRKETEAAPVEDGYTEIVKENASFETYYRGQCIIPTAAGTAAAADGEWDSFMRTLREPLPVTFRITGTRSWAQSVLSCLEKRYFNELDGLEVEGERISPPRPLTWYPENLAWHVSLSRKVIRSSPLLTKFHSFLVKESNQGNISRQEAVSMIPPLLLGVEPHHYVLDMCAAPGSKTSQLIEALHSQDTTESAIPGGVVIANDADNGRCYMLVHQAKRLNSPCLIVTNQDGSNFPLLYYHDDNDERHLLSYDRILCDVPCSGDGTLRKNPTIWKTWSPGTALSLHKLQLRLLTRGLELLKPGGQLVYSTCSLNPIENEAVIATAVKICKGSVEVKNCSEMLPGLKRVPGIATWKVMSKNGDWLPSFEETPPTSSYMIQSSMFPPTPEEADTFHLDRCMRILPHHQNTGGFFVAVLHKIAPLPWQPQTAPTVGTLGAGTAGCSSTGLEPRVEEKPVDLLGKPGYIKKKRTGYKEDPYVFLQDTDPIVTEISSYYNLSETFPKNQFLTRTHTGKKKTLYLTSPLVKELTKRNERDCKIINTGVRVFARCDDGRKNGVFRLSQEGVDTMKPYISNCIIPVSFSDLVIMLTQPNPLMSSLSADTHAAVKSFGTLKPVLFMYTPSERDTNEEQQQSNIDIQCPIYLSGWIAAHSVRLFVGHPDRYHYLAILGETPPEVLSLATVNGRTSSQFDEDDNKDVCDERSGDALKTDSLEKTEEEERKQQMEEHAKETVEMALATDQEKEQDVDEGLMEESSAMEEDEQQKETYM